MKRIRHLLIFLLISNNYFVLASAGFPGVEYSYAKMFLFNIEDSISRPDEHVYEDGIYAKSKIGEGIEVKQEILNHLNKIMSGDINSMLIGLSGCFQPRHGVIYYNENHVPVASVSICLECERIQYWTKGRFKYEVNSSRFSEEKAIKQFKFIKKNIVIPNLPVFEGANIGGQYLKFCKENTAFMNRGEITIHSDSLLKFFNEKTNLSQVQTWCKNLSKLKDDEVVKITAGGDKYSFKKQYYDSTEFLYINNDVNPTLTEAKIYSAEITLPNGVQVGMSFGEILNSIGVYDGPENPEVIIIDNDKVKLVYHFTFQTLKGIELSIIQ